MRFHAEKDSGSVPKSVPFPITCDVSVPWPSHVKLQCQNSICQNANKSFCPDILDDQISPSNKMADFEMHRLPTVENCSIWHFQPGIGVVLLSFEAKIQILTLEGQDLPKLMVS